MLFIYFIEIILISIFLVLSIAFSTLFERHILGLSQNRLGPNKNLIFGFVQPILDGLKLIFKEQIYILKSSGFFICWVPVIMFLVMFLNWFILPFLFSFVNFDMSLLFFFCLLGFSVYATMLSGIFSMSKYSIIGSIRSSNQSVSFEIFFSMFFLGFILIFMHLRLDFYFCIFFLFLMPVLIMVFLTELNRAPFDLSEGESELVSGFNTEFSSLFFVLLFLSEYGMLLFFGSLLGFIFGSFFFSIFFVFLFLFIRSCYPRVRYDLMMKLYWMIFLPLVFVFVIFMYLLFV